MRGSLPIYSLYNKEGPWTALDMQMCAETMYLLLLGFLNVTSYRRYCNKLQYTYAGILEKSVGLGTG
jgi:hypothetical protein